MSKAAPQDPKEGKKFRPVRYLPLLLLLLAAAAVLRPFVAESNDMAPGIQQGDLVIAAARPTWLFGELGHGDLVVLPPGDIRDRQLRRIIGMPGEVVELAAGKVLLEGVPLSGEFVTVMIYPVDGKPRRFRRRTEALPHGSLLGMPRVAESRYQVVEQEAMRLPDRAGVKLGPDEYYVLADRRTGARDSRDYGPQKGTTLTRVFALVLIPGYSLLLTGMH